MSSSSPPKDGIRWENASNRPSRETTSTHEYDIALLSEFMKGRLYFAVIRTLHKPPCTVVDHFFSTDNDFVYNPYNRDFGPLCLSSLVRYCCLLKSKLCCPSLRHKRIIHCTSLLNPQLRANASYLISAFAVLCLGRNPEEALAPLFPNNARKKTRIPPLLPFRDASLNDNSKKIHLSDCLYALYFALRCGFFDPNDFDVEEYERFLNWRNGDLNWVVPHRLLAFSGPQDIGFGYKPEVYVEYFKENNVTVVVRLNHPLYNESVFTNAGIHHMNLFFPDGTAPPNFIVKAFLKLCDEVEAGKWTLGIPGAVAVHCKAGLGRTGVLIASRLISRYGMRAKEAVAWLRICRSGSVMSSQQEWLEKNEGFLLLLSTNRALENEQCSRYEPPPFHGKHLFGIYSIREKLLAGQTVKASESSLGSLYVVEGESSKGYEADGNEEVEHINDQGTEPAAENKNVLANFLQSKPNKNVKPKKLKMKGCHKNKMLQKRSHS